MIKLSFLQYKSLHSCRYFSSIPAPTKPALLPRPSPKGGSLNQKPPFDLNEGPAVLSPPRKTRRVILPQREGGLEGILNGADMTTDERIRKLRNTGDNAGQSGKMPMSVDNAALIGSGTALRPTLNRYIYQTNTLLLMDFFPFTINV